MDAPAKVAAFAVGLVVAFGAAFGVGRAVGPLGEDRPPAAVTDHGDMDMGGHP